MKLPKLIIKFIKIHSQSIHIKIICIITKPHDNSVRPLLHNQFSNNVHKGTIIGGINRVIFGLLNNITTNPIDAINK